MLIQVVDVMPGRSSRTDQARALEWKVAPCMGKVDLSANGHMHCRCTENLWAVTLRRHSLKKGRVQKTGN